MGLKILQVKQRGQELKDDEILMDNPGIFNGILHFFLHLEISNAFMQFG